MFNAINLKRKAVVIGDHEPADEECDAPLIHNLDEDELQKLENNAPVEGTPSKGVPGFCFYALNNASQISDMIHEYDAPILKFLVDISLQVHTDPTGFSLLFHFAENPYFTNAILTKYYELKIAPDNDDPLVSMAQPCRQEEAKEGCWGWTFHDEDRAKRSFFNFFDAVVKELTENLEAEIEHGMRVDFENGSNEDFDDFDEDEDDEDSDGALMERR
uniref:Uncharacterized protein n=1 Tax=Ditylenchus dipsaci TaxID=166011 RepID=A0A915CPD5_9BILA